MSTQVRPPDEPPTRIVRRPHRRGLGTLALATACGVLLGILVATTLGTGDQVTTQTQRVTVTTSAPATGGTVITKTLVPVMVGQPLDVAKQRAERAGFSVTVDAGGGVFGVLRDENWEVVAQRPGPQELIEQGSRVHVDIVKR